MSTLGNIVYLIFGGWLIGLGWAFSALLCACTIIGLPFVPGLLRISRLAFWPFGMKVVSAKEIEDGQSQASGIVSLVFNFFWAISIGLFLFFTHVFAAIAQAVTVIGIPFAFQTLKLGIVAFAPFGKRVVSEDDLQKIKIKRAIAASEVQKSAANVTNLETKPKSNTSTAA